MSSTLTDSQAYALAGGIIGGMISAFIVIALIFYVLVVIALWKIFTKAGEAGWKALIPIYNVYILCKIIGINFWIYVLLIPIIIGFIAGLVFGDNQQRINLVSSLYTLFFAIYMSRNLAKAFGKGIGFTIGLVLLPNIFQLILGFGSAEYVGIPEK